MTLQVTFPQVKPTSSIRSIDCYPYFGIPFHLDRELASVAFALVYTVVEPKEGASCLWDAVGGICFVLEDIDPQLRSVLSFLSFRSLPSKSVLYLFASALFQYEAFGYGVEGRFQSFLLFEPGLSTIR